MGERSYYATSEKSESYKSLQNALKERLKKLRVARGLTHDELLEKFNEFSSRKYGIVTTKENLKNYASAKAIPRIDMLCAIADFFNVSVDYLLGVNDYTTVTNELIGRELGLTNDAIIGLSVIDELFPEEQKLLCSILSTRGFLNFLHDFHDYIFCKYKVPVYFGKSGYSAIPNSYSKEYDDWTLYLASSAKTPSDCVPLSIDDDFFMAVTKEKIRSDLDDIKREYLNEIKKSDGGKVE